MKIRDFFCTLLLTSALFPVSCAASSQGTKQPKAAASVSNAPTSYAATLQASATALNTATQPSATKSSGEVERFNKSLKTYVGVYACKEGRYGERELTECVDALRLELKADGSYRLTFPREKGNSFSCTGKYSVDGETLVFSQPRGDGLPVIDGVRRAYAHKNGEIVLATNIGGKILYLRFARP